MKKILACLIAISLSMAVFAQIEDPVKWSYGAKQTSSTEATVFIKATIANGWHIYSLNVKDGGPKKTKLIFAPSATYSLLGKASEPAPIVKFEKSFTMNVGSFEKEVVFQQKIKLKSSNTSVIKGKIEYMACNDHKCLSPDDVDFSIPLAK